jgi:hypothetical protein
MSGPQAKVSKAGLPAKTKQQILTLLDSQVPLFRIAERLGVSVDSVYRIRDKHKTPGIPNAPISWFVSGVTYKPFDPLTPLDSLDRQVNELAGFDVVRLLIPMEAA